MLSKYLKFSLTRLQYFLQYFITEFYDTVSVIIIIKLSSNACYVWWECNLNFLLRKENPGHQRNKIFDYLRQNVNLNGLTF